MVQNAARQTDPVAHSSNFVPTVMAVGGVVIGVVVTVLNPAGATFIAAVTYSSSWGQVGAYLGEQISSGQLTTDGGEVIADGARTVYTEGQRQAKAHPMTVVTHSGMPRIQGTDSKYVCTGSSTVFVESKPASRRFDFTTCGGVLYSGAPHVFIGGGIMSEAGRRNPAPPNEERTGALYELLTRTLSAMSLASRPTNFREMYEFASSAAEAAGYQKHEAHKFVDALLAARGIRRGPQVSGRS